jgi:hypothetical protein
MHAPVPECARRIDQIFRVRLGVVAARKHCLIAGLLGKRRQSPLEPPCQRMKPEHRAIQQCEPLYERIATTNVSVLVGQHGVKPDGRPMPPRLGQNDNRSHPPNGDRRCARGTNQPAITDD